MNRTRALLLSGSVILLCTMIITGVSFALFSESVTMSNHLQAGELTLQLTRTDLKYEALNSKGYLELVENHEEVDFSATNAADANIFDLSADARTYIAPGSYFEASMKLENTGDVAFTYEVMIKMASKDADVNEDIADQLLMTVTDAEGNVINEKLLSEFYTDEDGYTLISDVMERGDEADTFTVKVRFLDSDNDDDKAFLKDDANNNDAQSETALFDLYVIATQKTTAPEQSVAESVFESETAAESSTEE